ncbi:MAG: ferritin family protein [Methermicoccaceae archaeon]
MFGEVPINLEMVADEEIDKEIIRVAIMAELDAINLYEQLANMAEDESLKDVLLDIAREEKTHVGEFMSILLIADEEQREEFEAGKAEVREIIDG